jgi:hypothetical protein
MVLWKQQRRRPSLRRSFLRLLLLEAYHWYDNVVLFAAISNGSCAIVAGCTISGIVVVVVVASLLPSQQRKSVAKSDLTNLYGDTL